MRFIVYVISAHNDNSSLTCFGIVWTHTVLNNLLNNCKFLWFNTNCDCAVTKSVNFMLLYNNREFNRPVNSPCWCSDRVVHCARRRNVLFAQTRTSGLLQQVSHHPPSWRIGDFPSLPFIHVPTARLKLHIIHTRFSCIRYIATAKSAICTCSYMF